MQDVAARIGLERDAQGVPGPAEVVRRRRLALGDALDVRGVEAPGAFEHRVGTEEAGASQRDRRQPAVRRPTRVQPLQPRGPELEHARRHAAAQAQRPDQRRRVGLGKTRRRSRGGESAADGGRMEAAPGELAGTTDRQPAADLERRGEGEQHLLAAGAVGLPRRKRCRERRRAGMVDAADVGVVKVEAVRQDAVDERCRGRGQRCPGADGHRRPALAHFADALQRHPPEVEPGRCDGDAEDVEEVSLRQVLDGGRDLIERQAERELRESGGLGDVRRRGA